jgi:hypothetical protein
MKTMYFSFCRAGWLLQAGALIALHGATTFGQVDTEHEPHERMRDPYMPPPPLRLSVPLGGFTERQGFPFHAQVNVTPEQMNILDDAANEPSIAVDPTAPNRIAIGWRQFDNRASDFRQAGYAWSNDGGRTWRKSTLNPGVFRSDPVLRAGPDGTIYYNSLTNNFNCWVFRSGDGGQSWSDPVNSFGGDKQWMVVDRTNGPGRGFIHQWWSTAGNPFAPNQFSRSTTGGLSWDLPSIVTNSPRWGTMAIGPAGELYLAVGNGAPQVIRSTNARIGGVTPTFLAGASLAFTNGGIAGANNPAGLSGQANVAVDTSGGARMGWVYLLTTVQAAGGYDVVFARSVDGGVSWHAPVLFRGGSTNHTNSFQWFGTMSISPNGRLDVVYNDTSETHVPTMSRTVYVSSSDGGTTWSAPMPLGPIWNSTLGWPNQEKIGDYYDMESDLLGANLAYATTYNLEQDVYFARIGPRDCNSNGTDDTQDIASGASTDANMNGIPDACEIAAGAVADENSNGIPDDACDSIDYNSDGLFPDTGDIDAFLVVFSGGPCPSTSCNDIDFNNDGLFPDTGDIDALLRVFSGGPC